ncbi:MAG: S41 family peptidase [Chloroflexota bacterium]
MEFLRKHHEKFSTGLLLVAIFLAGFAVGGITPGITFAQDNFAIGDTDEAFAPLYEVFETIQARYVDTDNVEIDTLIDGAIEGMVDSLGDPYSGYLDAEAFNMFSSDLSGDIEGIGVVIFTNDDDNVEVRQVLEGTGAEAAGVLPGDVFADVDGTDVLGMDQTELALLVRGEAGTTVNVTFLRDGEEVTLEITRVRFEVPNVEYEVFEDSNIAYISMAEFNERSVEQFNDALEAVEIDQRDGLIFDLRNNPGGLLSTAIDMASVFIDDGVILYESFADGSEQTFEANGSYAGIEVPIVVLINENSASASELVSGAMRDQGVATLIGEVSFGKGTVQTLQPLSNNGALRITIARYLLPSRLWIHDVGVTPDIIVELDELNFVDGDPDPQLEAAIDYILDGDLTSDQ